MNPKILPTILSFLIAISSVTILEANNIRWSSVKPHTDYYYKINLKISSRAMIDVRGGRATNGNNIWIYSSNNTDAQMFRFRPSGRGYYEIVSKLNGNMVLEVRGGRATKNANIHLNRRRRGSAAQRFKLVRNQYGIVQILSALSNKYAIDVHKGQSGNGTNVQLYTRNFYGYNKAQNFKLIRTRVRVGTPKPRPSKTLSSKQRYIIIPYENPHYGFGYHCGQPCNYILVRALTISRNQKDRYQFIPAGNNMYYIKRNGRQFITAVKRGGRGSIQTLRYQRGNAQKFRLRFFPGGAMDIVEIESVAYPGYVIDVPGGKASENKSLWLYRRNNTDAQRFALGKR